MARVVFQALRPGAVDGALIAWRGVVASLDITGWASIVAGQRMNGQNGESL